MAIAGRKPKSIELHLLAGTYNTTNHNKRAANIPQGKGKPVCPIKLKKKVQNVWDRCIEQWTWLTDADSDKLLLYCFLEAEFENNPTVMNAAKIGHIRKLSSELGGDPVSRIRMGTPSDKPDKKKDKYFD